jgi:hypothetical protein
VNDCKKELRNGYCNSCENGIGENMHLFDTFPRYCGNPNQYIVDNIFEMNNFISNNNGIHPCFARCFRIINNQHEIDKIPFDLDSTTGLSGPILDREKLTQWSRATNNLYATTYSGRKGFHFYIRLKPSITDFPRTKLESVQRALIHELELNTADLLKLDGINKYELQQRLLLRI